MMIDEHQFDSRRHDGFGRNLVELAVVSFCFQMSAGPSVSRCSPAALQGLGRDSCEALSVLDLQSQRSNAVRLRSSCNNGVFGAPNSVHEVMKFVDAVQ